MFSPVHAGTDASHGAFRRWHSTPEVDADLTLDATTAEELQSQLTACNDYATSVTSSWGALVTASDDTVDIETKLPTTVAELFGTYASPALTPADKTLPVDDDMDDLDCLSGPDTSAVPSNALKPQGTSYSILQYEDSVDSSYSLTSTYSQESTSSSPWTAVHSWDSRTDQSDDELSLPDEDAAYSDAAPDSAAVSSVVAGSDDVLSVTSSSATQPLPPGDSLAAADLSSEGDEYWTCPICLEPRLGCRSHHTG